jgi:mannose-6-phosphate isomerase-like protein (cupin superfamily)
LRILGPMELAGKYEWYELMLQPGGELASQAHDPGTSEHLTVLTGAVELEVGPEKKRVKHGATARYPADVAHTIRNTG